MDSITPLKNLSHDISKLYNKRENADVKFIVGLPISTTFYGHTLILSCRSAYFDKAFSVGWKDTVRRVESGVDKGMILFEKPNVDPEVFASLLKFAYTGIIDIVQHDLEHNENITNKELNNSLEEDYVHILEQFHEQEQQEVAHNSFSSSQHQHEKIISPMRYRPRILDASSSADALHLLHLLVLSDELQITDLISLLQHHLIMHYPTYISRNPLRIITLADQHSWLRLRSFAIWNLCRDPYPIFFSSMLWALEEDLLCEILDRDDFCMDEADIWEILLRWSYYRHKNSSGVSMVDLDMSISSSYVETASWILEHFFRPLPPPPAPPTLTPLLHHLRIFQISGPTFITTLDPYNILPIALRESLLKYYILSQEMYRPRNLPRPFKYLPARKQPIFHSTILTGKHRLLVQQWIQASLCGNSENELESETEPVGETKIAVPIQRDWKLLYRASKDGFSARSFHTHCDNKGPTVVVAKVKGNPEILGGFNPISWKSIQGGGYANAVGAFLFRFGRSAVEIEGIQLDDEDEVEDWERTNIEGENQHDSRNPRLRRVVSLVSETAESDVYEDEEITDAEELVSDNDYEEEEEVNNNTDEGNQRNRPNIDGKAVTRNHNGSENSDHNNISQRRSRASPAYYPLRPHHNPYAIYHHASYGPIFGAGHDLFLGHPMDEPVCFARGYAYEGWLRPGSTKTINENYDGPVNSQEGEMENGDFACEEVEVWAI